VPSLPGGNHSALHDAATAQLEIGFGTVQTLWHTPATVGFRVRRNLLPSSARMSSLL
jgi:hypothetical protein